MNVGCEQIWLEWFCTQKRVFFLWLSPRLVFSLAEVVLEEPSAEDIQGTFNTAILLMKGCPYCHVNRMPLWRGWMLPLGWKICLQRRDVGAFLHLWLVVFLSFRPRYRDIWTCSWSWPQIWKWKKIHGVFRKKNESMAIGDSTRMLLLLLKARITVAKESDKGYAGDLRNCRVGVILHCRLSVIGLH